MKIHEAARDVLYGASLRQVAGSLREELITTARLRPDEVAPEVFRDEVGAFMRQLARHLGEKHSGDSRAGHALREWVRSCDHYEAWDSLLSEFAIEGREALVRRGRMLFPGSLTAHWDDS